MGNYTTDEFKVSVIIPTYNSAQYIDETLKSVVNQTLAAYEIIVVDDGSTDATPEILSKYGSTIRVVRQTNQGVSAARNHGIQKAQGNWVAFIDSDDIWHKEKLELQLNSLGKSEWSHTNSLYFGENQNGETTRSDLTTLHSGYVLPSLIVENFITTSTVLIKKELLITHGCFDETLKTMEDWYLWLKVAQKSPLHCSPLPLTDYRVHLNSTSRNVEEVMQQHKTVIEKIYLTIDIPVEIKQSKSKSLSQSYSICSYIAEDANRKTLVFYYALRALIYHPFSALKLRRFFSAIVFTLKPKGNK